MIPEAAEAKMHIDDELCADECVSSEQVSEVMEHICWSFWELAPRDAQFMHLLQLFGIQALVRTIT